MTTPRPRRRETPVPPTYTLEEATRALPLIRAIARDAHATYLRLRAGLAALRSLRRLEELSSDQSLPRETRDALGELRDLVLELEQLGARIEDPELGVVSLRGRYEDRDVAFCWKLGEEEIGYWYPIESTYESRRPVADLEPAA